jgi:hypothetical protein
MKKKRKRKGKRRRRKRKSLKWNYLVRSPPESP